MFSSLNTNKFQPLTIPLKDGSKFFIYFKKFNLQNLNSSPSEQSLYEIFKKTNENTSVKPIKNTEKHYDLPTKRTLLCINLDREFIQEKIKKIFRVLGKIRQIFTGSFQAKKKIGYFFSNILEKACNFICKKRKTAKNHIFFLRDFPQRRRRAKSF